MAEGKWIYVTSGSAPNGRVDQVSALKRSGMPLTTI